jgi:two-component system response regulator GlrR
MGSGDDQLTVEQDDAALAAPAVRRFRLEGAGKAWESGGDRCSIGLHELNDLVLDDPTVSRFHCEIVMTPAGPLVRDLHSRNGTFVDGVRVIEAFVRDRSVLRLGASSLSLILGSDHLRLPVSTRTRFGGLVGRSAAMRATFVQLERAAATDSTVLLEGETGTGKGEAARALHEAGARARGPFMVVDCGALPENLLDSELFGHERGAFTGAEQRRIGTLEEASGGTVFLDEIGELPPELQPKLLRAIESRQVRRLGTNQFRTVDVRVVAATHRDLRAEVNAGRFRADLYFRLAVVKIALPPLRARPEDLPELVEKLLGELRAGPQALATLSTPSFLAALGRAAWPGNVRELRNHLERCLVFEGPVPLADAPPGEAPFAIDAARPFADARAAVLRDFEREYVRKLLALHGDNVTEAARAAGLNRAYLYRLIGRGGIRRDGA